MAAPKFISRIAGRLAEVLTIQSSAGSGDADKVPATGPDGKLDMSFMPSGTGPQQRQMVASEGLAAGDLVNVWDPEDTDGEAQVRKADADIAGRQAHGYVLESYESAATATVYFEGEITGLTGKTPGKYQYLSATAGEMTETPPTGAGVTSQIVGVALSDTVVQFELHEPVTLAG